MIILGTSPFTSTVPVSNESVACVRRTFTQLEKSDLIALFAESGLSAADFCWEMAISPANFTFWRRQSPGEAGEPVESAEERVAAVTAGISVTITPCRVARA